MTSINSHTQSLSGIDQPRPSEATSPLSGTRTSGSPATSLPGFQAGLRPQIPPQTGSRATGLSQCRFASTSPVGLAPKGATVLHINDLHGFIRGNDAHAYAGGLARLATAIKQVAEENVERNFKTIVTIAGDIFTGGTDFDGRLVVDTLATMQAELKPYNVQFVAVLGNHESDHGLETLMNYIEKSAFPVLGANIGLTDDAQGVSTPLADGTTLLDIGGGKKIAIVGITTDTKVPTDVKTKDKRKIPLTTADPVAIAPQQLAVTAQARPAATVLLTHVGDEAKTDLAKAVRGDVDVIIGGHTHDPDPSPDDAAHFRSCTDIKGVPYCRVPSETGVSILGRVDITFDKDKNKVSSSGIPLMSSIPEDPDIGDYIDERIEEDRQAHPENYAPVGMLLDSDGHRIDELKLSRSEQCTLGQLTTQGMIDAARNYIPQDKPVVALLNTGAMRGDITSDADGVVLSGQRDRVFKYNNNLVTVKITGKQLAEMLKKSETQKGSGEYLQHAGVPDPIDPTQTYTVVTIDYLLESDDTYFQKGTAYEPVGLASDNTVTIRDAFSSGLKPITPSVAGETAEKETWAHTTPG
ncbi:MAG: bifunctional metallophosphatase/5'-nucleotidase [Deltaproteobacteria bacterium]|nr:bifunctional metallophosphatase/5'-nucleotidase [Deltaproteobacteria bacterium]